MKAILLPIVALLTLCVGANATVVTPQPITVPGFGQRYIDVIATSTGAEVWFRVYPNACANADRRVATLAKFNVNFGQAWQFACAAKPYVNGAQTLVACGAGAYSAACFGGVTNAHWITAAACTVVIPYWVTAGERTCIANSSTAIASYLTGRPSWQTTAVYAQITGPTFGDLVDVALDWACSHP